MDKSAKVAITPNGTPSPGGSTTVNVSPKTLTPEKKAWCEQYKKNLHNQQMNVWLAGSWPAALSPLLAAPSVPEFFEGRPQTAKKAAVSSGAILVISTVVALGLNQKNVHDLVEAGCAKVLP